MRSSEVLYMDWEMSMCRTKAILEAICMLCDDLDDIGNEERVESIWHLAELAQAIVADQLVYSLEQEKREKRAQRKKKVTPSVSTVSVSAEGNHHGPQVETL
jgi:hypothetical protein